MTPNVSGDRAPNRASTAAVPALLWQAIVWAAVAQAAAGVADLTRDAVSPGGLAAGRLLMLAHVLVFGAVGGTLIRYGRGDDRARSLGAALLLTAAVFARSTVQPRGDPAGWAALVEAAFALRVDALTPYFTWRFAGEFPRALTSVRGRRWLGRVTRVALALGLVLVVANALSAAAAHVDALRALAPLLARLSRREAGSLYFPLQYLLAAAAFVVLVLRARRAPADERRRVRLLVWGLVAGTAPAIAWVLLASVVPGFIEVLPVRRAGWVVYPALLSTPISTAYAVLVRRALDVRVVVRRALQYALARYSTIAFAAVPAVLLVGLLYRRRGESVGAALASADAAALLALTAGGVALLRGRAGLLSRIDRRFFREQHDARRVLADLVERCRAAGDRAELSRALVAGLDRALHPGAVGVVFLDGDDTAVESTADMRPLPTPSALPAALADASGALDVDLEDPAGAARALPEADQHWLLDGGVRLLLPLRGAGSRLAGIVALGEKKSELPYSAEDRTLLAAVAAAAGMALALHGADGRAAEERTHPELNAVADRAASECTGCGAVGPADAAACGHCGASTRPCLLPQVVGGKFLLEERVGAGAMGVVYRALDVHLDRAVAIKTLPHLAPAEALRLRREARAIATVTHPNLAVIFGAESWRGQPMLVFEYLGGGTLADRLARRPLVIAEALDLGLALSAVVAAIHDAGVLHCDIKPTNIGFTRDGTPKLLDFGLARVLTAARADAAAAVDERLAGRSGDRTASESGWPGSMSESAVRGTPLYMAPEARIGDAPSPSFDLWSLCVVLYEGLAGRHPYGADGQRPRWPPPAIPDIREYVPAAGPAIAGFFRRALSERLAERPASAAALGRALRDLRRDGDIGESAAARGGVRPAGAP